MIDPTKYSIVILIILIIGTVIFFDAIVTGVVLASFSNFLLNGIVFSPECGPDEDPNVTGCYDKDNIDGGQVLNCLHSGICPIGVNWQPTGSEEWDATPDSDPHPDDPYQPPTVNPASLIDTDGDGIFDDKDGCVFEPELVNGFLDTDGCPESSESPDVNELPEVTIENTIINPPDISASFIDEVAELGFSSNNVNLNDTVDSAIILVVVVLIAMILALIMVLKKNLGKKKRR